MKRRPYHGFPWSPTVPNPAIMGGVNEASRPVAVRVIRPYLSEDEYLATEGDSITKTTIELVGAHSRPAGVVLRFEVTLQSGKTLIRGEGRVTQFNERGRGDQPSLSLRFTKLDAKSKALIDRAVAMRQPGGAPPAPSPSSPEIHPLIPPAAPSSAPGEEMAPTPIPPAPITASVEVDDPDPEGSAETTAPPRVVTSEPASPERSSEHPGTTRPPATAPPPTTRPSVLPPAVRAELRRMSDLPPPLPSALPAYEPAEPAMDPPHDAADQAADDVVTSAASAASPAYPAATAPAGSAFPTGPPAPPAPSSIIGSATGGANRDALLSRLRERALALPPDRVAEITKPRPRGMA